MTRARAPLASPRNEKGIPARKLPNELPQPSDSPQKIRVSATPTEWSAPRQAQAAPQAHRTPADVWTFGIVQMFFGIRTASHYHRRSLHTPEKIFLLRSFVALCSSRARLVSIGDASYRPLEDSRNTFQRLKRREAFNSASRL